jgi:anthranilate 1,2-dioxygenase small subunit
MGGAADPRSELRREVRDLYEDYAACLDDVRLEDWPTFFTEDACYKVISAENFDGGLPHATIYCDGRGMIRDRALAVSKTMVYQPRRQRRFLGAVRIDEAAGATIRSQASFLITQCMLDAEPQLVMAGRYIDQLIRQPDGRLRFRERSCVYDNFRVSQSIIIPV